MTSRLRSAPGVAIMLACGPAMAAEPAAGAGGLLAMLPGLAIVLALIFALAFVARRFGPARASQGPLRLVASQGVGTRERVVVLEIAGQWLVLGVAPGQVRALSQLPRPADAGIETAAAEADRPAFAHWLARAMKKP